MGIWLSFKNSKIDFSCSYNYWNIIRISIVKSFINYLENWININSTTFVKGETYEFYCYEDIKQLVTDYNNIVYEIDFFIIFNKYILIS